MIRKLMASSALLALVAAGNIGVAQSQTDTQQPAVIEQPAAGADQGAAPMAGQDGAGVAAAAGQTEIAKDAPNLTPDEPTIATAFIGRPVYSSEDPQSDNIGEVNDLIIGSDGMITHAVVGVGGFLGIGEKDVSVPFDQLQVVQDEGGDVRLIYAATKDQLEAAEAFDRTAFDPEERVEEQQEAAADADAGVTTDPAVTTDMTATDPAAPATTDMAATDPAAPAADSAATDPAAPATTDMAATDPATPATTDITATDPAAPATTDTAATDPAAPATTDMAATDPAAPATTDMAASDPAAPATADTEMAAETSATAGEGFVSFSADQVRASALMGQEVYGSENESIGEVSDLILQDDGKTRAALIDVGGFLGVGEKRVAIPFDQIEVTAPADAAMADQTAATDQTAPTDPATDGEQTAATDPAAPAAEGEQTAATDPAAQPDPAVTVATDEPRLTVAMTKEQIEQLPEWQEAAADASTDAMSTDTATTADPNAPAGTVDPNAPAATDTAAAPDQFAPVTQQLTADNLMGSAVYGANEENLGEVGDVVFNPTGEIQAVVVDVGGFLGIGEKPVAVQFDSLNVQKNGDGDFRLMVNATQEQLENAPSYDEDAGDQAQAPATVQ